MQDAGEAWPTLMPAPQFLCLVSCVLQRPRPRTVGRKYHQRLDQGVGNYRSLHFHHTLRAGSVLVQSLDMHEHGGKGRVSHIPFPRQPERVTTFECHPCSSEQPERPSRKAAQQSWREGETFARRRDYAQDRSATPPSRMQDKAVAQLRLAVRSMLQRGAQLLLAKLQRVRRDHPTLRHRLPARFALGVPAGAGGRGVS